MTQKKEWAVFGLILLIPLFTLFYNIERAYMGQQHAIDSGIYQQAIMELAYSPSWNPYVTVRGGKIFNDHVDPVILIPAVIERVIGPKAWFPFFFEWFLFFAGGIFILWATKKKSFQWRAFALSMWLFCDGLLGAVRFHIHPTTWSMFSILLLFYFLREKKFFLVMVMANVLCLHKEYFPFCFLMLGIYFCIQKSYRYGLASIAQALAWLSIDFFFRPKILGPIYDFSGGMTEGLIHHPFSTIGSAAMNFRWRETLIPGFPTLLAWGLTLKYTKEKSWVMATAIFILPVLAIQFLFGQMGLQYGAPIYATFLSGVLLSEGDWFFSNELWMKRARIFLWITLVYAGGDALLHVRGLASMLQDTEKRRDFEVATLWIHSQAPDTKILATGGLIPFLLKPGQLIYTWGVLSEPQPSYQVLAIAGCGTSDSYPITCERSTRTIERCRLSATEIVMDTKNIFIAKGNFTSKCID